jgi:hypothetical protein
VAISPLTLLERERDRFGPDSAARKLRFLARVGRASMPNARDLVRLHEVLCFMRAYADDARVLAAVERLLAGFGSRADLRRQRDSLADTGIAGTVIHYRFFWATVEWLARRWPAQLRLDRDETDGKDAIGAALPLLATAAEAAALRELDLPAFTALDRLRGRGETDAACLARLIEAMPGDTFTREAFSDAIDASYELAPGRDTPSRTRAKHRPAPLAFQRTPLARTRPDLRLELDRPVRATRKLSLREGARLIDLARGAMITRGRDLDAFSYGNAGDVLMVDDGDGLEFALTGVVPERRAPVIATFGHLILRNGVPIGYGDVLATGRSAAVSFNIFETVRGAEAGRHFARQRAVRRHVLGIESFQLYPYQLGQHNDEAIASGAWWFYYKLGFRPQRADALRLARRELARMAQRPDYRSSEATLRRLAEAHLFFSTGNEPMRLCPAAPAGLAISAGLARSPRRAAALAVCERRAMRILGLRSFAGFSAAERQAWTRWSPLIAYAIAGVARWSRADKRALVALVRAKGGQSEARYLELFAAHPRLAAALSGKAVPAR